MPVNRETEMAEIKQLALEVLMRKLQSKNLSIENLRRQYRWLVDYFTRGVIRS